MLIHTDNYGRACMKLVYRYDEYTRPRALTYVAPKCWCRCRCCLYSD